MGKKLKTGEVVSGFRRKLVAMKWMDKRELAIMSSIHDATMKEVRSKRGRKKMKPKACLDYNNAMWDLNMLTGKSGISTHTDSPYIWKMKDYQENTTEVEGIYLQY
ncbi:hypothetical protein J437_LFUL007961 [Ladona fulva]|uniref:PiggyBac transposable element-derived protein domain-containing protein n=1 Tax=Ladona fulva TaxID=123851 RepID=A0A8K0P4H7_LADFU|nr:hypothetical protein J437_LFUL007961 [Ladona fulva]